MLCSAGLPYQSNKDVVLGGAMKMLSEYLEHAINFERMAAQEVDPVLKEQFESQAAAYRKLAKERAIQYGLPLPSSPEK
jgi:hypothetical protein